MKLCIRILRLIVPIFVLSTGTVYPATFDVTNNNNLGIGSLRWAIVQANSDAVRDSILFHIPPTGTVASIRLTTALPAITESVIIDGRSQRATNWPPSVEINGSNIATVANGLMILSSNCEIHGLIINQFSDNGIYISNSVGGNSIEGNFIGTDISGTADWGNAANGVLIVKSPNNAVGDTVVSDTENRNIISGNDYCGVYITGGASMNNWLENNRIGTDVSGSTRLPNSFYGVLVDKSATLNQIGSEAGPKPVNVISGNGMYGIRIDGPASGNHIRGNNIGVGADGYTRVYNGSDGVLIYDSGGNFVGSDSGEGGNVISGNGDDGVEINWTNSNGNYVYGNRIGTAADGTTRLPNDDDGVVITVDCMQNRIGGFSVHMRNVISGNDGCGIRISDRAHGNEVYANYIGLAQDGMLVCSNGEHGILLTDHAYVNQIGGTIDYPGNYICGNGGILKTWDGIHVEDSSDNNTFYHNVIGLNTANGKAGNTRDGIRIENSMSNNVGDSTGGVNGQNVISGNEGNGVYVGTNANFTDVMYNYIGTDTNGLAARPNGKEGVNIYRSTGVMLQYNILSGNQGNGVMIGDNDSAHHNTVANNNIGTDVNGAYPVGNSDRGVYVLNSPSNTIGTGGGANVISGNDSHGVEITGSTAVRNYIYANSIGTTLDGLNALANGGAGVLISDNAADNRVGNAGTGNIIAGNENSGVQIQNSTRNWVRGNQIGAGAATNPLPNLGHGVFIFGAGASNNMIGQVSSGNGNLIAFNAGAGVRILSSANTCIRNSIRFNSIYSNTLMGIDLDNAGVSANDVGDPDLGANNIQNFPVIYSATTGSVMMSGMLNSDQPFQSYALDIFVNDRPDGTGYGEGQIYLASTTVVLDASGYGYFTNIVLTNTVTTGQYITATATDPWGNTSEFSLAVPIVPTELYDQDGDGMPSSWERDRNLNYADATGTNGAAGDPDGDSAINIDEYIADTKPSDSNSLFQIVAHQLPTNALVTYSSTNTRYYLLYYGQSCEYGSTWSCTATPAVQGSNGVTTASHTGSQTCRMYRVDVRLTP